MDRTQGESMRCTQAVPFAGYKFQLNDVAAAIGLANLEGIDAAVREQRAHACYYDLSFADGPVRPLKRDPRSSCWLYSVRVLDARTFIERMAARGIECSQVHNRNDTQPIFAAARTPLPMMDRLDRELVCLPVGWWSQPTAIA
jgi:dTDP-4-amino-4,6-dideoxygalactose transaminase